MRYDSGDAAVIPLTENNLTGIAGATFSKFHLYAKSKLRRVSALVITAGTNAAAGIDIFVGTTSVGSITVGTNTAGVVVDSGSLDVLLTPGSNTGQIDMRGKANSATMAVSLCCQVQAVPDAVVQ